MIELLKLIIQEGEREGWERENNDSGACGSCVSPPCLIFLFILIMTDFIVLQIIQKHISI